MDTYPSSLLQVGYHHNDDYSLFPDHSPIIVKGGHQGSLCTYVGSWLAVTLLK